MSGERYRLRSGEIQIEEWRDTDCKEERYRLKSGEMYSLRSGVIQTDQTTDTD